MIIPSVAITNWILTSAPGMIILSGKIKVALIFAGSVALATLMSGVVPHLIVAPNWSTAVDIEKVMILHFATWTAPFIGSAVTYFFMKRISLELINKEWVSLTWLILNIMAVAWSSAIHFALSGPSDMVDATLGFRLMQSVMISFLSIGVLLISLLLGRGTAIRPLFAASIWLAVLNAMTPGLMHAETPEILKILYSFELGLTLAAVFFITSWVFGVGSPRSAIHKKTVIALRR